MLFLSYVPLLTSARGGVRPPEEKESLIQMLTEASQSYRIEGVAWALEEHHTGTRPYPVFLVQHASDICNHLVQWSEGRPESYFTLVWRPNGQGYDLALVPNFQKSARRYQSHSGGRSPEFTILGHIFLYQAQSQLDLQTLENRPRIRLGWASQMTDGSLEDYAEVTVRCRKWSLLPKDEQENLAKYWITS
jgi:hypothetical protein